MEDKVSLHRKTPRQSIHRMTSWRSGMTTTHAKTHFNLFAISLVFYTWDASMSNQHDQGSGRKIYALPVKSQTNGISNTS